MVGNILLIIAFLLFLSILPAQIGLEKTPGGDYGVGYAWMLIIKGALFVIFLLAITINIGLNGGFTSMAYKDISGIKMVMGGLLLLVMCIVTISKGSFTNWNISQPIIIAIGCIPVALQILFLMAAFVFLNQKMLNSPFLLKGISWALTGVAILGILVIFFGDIMHTQQLRKDFMKDNPMGLDENQQRMLREIDSCDVSKDMVFLLVFTNANQHKLIREKALAKMKTNANWEEELITKLQNDWAPEVFTFLASNDVENPAIYLEPVRKGILVQAKLVRERIRNASHQSNFYSGLFSWEIESVIRTVDKFENMGIDYGSAMKELRSALNEPSHYEKGEFSITSKLDKWLKNHDH